MQALQPGPLPPLQAADTGLILMLPLILVWSLVLLIWSFDSSLSRRPPATSHQTRCSCHKPKGPTRGFCTAWLLLLVLSSLHFQQLGCISDIFTAAGEAHPGILVIAYSMPATLVFEIFASSKTTISG